MERREQAFEIYCLLLEQAKAAKLTTHDRTELAELAYQSVVDFDFAVDRMEGRDPALRDHLEEIAQSMRRFRRAG